MNLTWETVCNIYILYFLGDTRLRITTLIAKKNQHIRLEITILCNSLSLPCSQKLV